MNQSALKQKKRLKKHKHIIHNILLVTAGVVVIGSAGLGGAEVYQHITVKQTSATIQTANLAKPIQISNSNQIATNQDDIDYGSHNHGIPNASRLEEYAKQPNKIYGRGYIAIPKQNGVSQPIASLAIHEGASDKVLAVGAGTPRVGEKMGKGNFSIAAHNFGNNQTYFSPMQNSIDVNKQPFAYLTDGQLIYTYQFNRENDQQLSGRTVVDYHQGSVLDDSVAKGGSILTLITCDEPGIFTLTPENRLLLRAHLVEVEPVDKASDSERALFPQIF